MGSEAPSGREMPGGLMTLHDEAPANAQKCCGCLGLGLAWAWPTGRGCSSRGSSGQRQPAQICTLREIEDDRLWGPEELGQRKLGKEKGERGSWAYRASWPPASGGPSGGPPSTLKPLSEL